MVVVFFFMRPFVLWICFYVFGGEILAIEPRTDHQFNTNPIVHCPNRTRPFSLRIPPNPTLPPHNKHTLPFPPSVFFSLFFLAHQTRPNSYHQGIESETPYRVLFGCSISWWFNSRCLISRPEYWRWHAPCDDVVVGTWIIKIKEYNSVSVCCFESLSLLSLSALCQCPMPMMSSQVVKRERAKLEACMTCPLCNKLFSEATTISECLHTCQYLSLSLCVLLFMLIRFYVFLDLISCVVFLFLTWVLLVHKSLTFLENPGKLWSCWHNGSGFIGLILL